MFVCYLDDSGTDRQNRLVTVAGYVARAAAWKTFEQDVEPVFERRKVRILHAKEMEATDGDFKGWSVLNKQAFVAEICQRMSRHVALGVTMSAVKETFRIRAKESGRKRTVTPYTFCFNAILDYLLRSTFIGRLVHHEGIAFILEAGNHNNAEAEKEFHWVQENKGVENVLRSISFVPKTNSRAIQIADLLAFYARRDNTALEKAKREGKDDYRVELMMKLISGAVPHWGFVATDFERRHR
jgi:Protein of unknown function (DUF3800)